MCSQPPTQIYSLDAINEIFLSLAGQTAPLLNNFVEFYEKLEVKMPDISNFRRGKFFNKNGNGNTNGRNNTWRRRTRIRGKELEKFLETSYVKFTTDNNRDKMHRTIISHLNKLNEKKFTIIMKEFIDGLEELMFAETYDILNEEIMKKVYDDTHYVGLYSRLVKELVINKKWQKKMFNVVENKSGQFYWSLNKIEEVEDVEFFGPFGSQEEAIEDGMHMINFKKIFCGYLQTMFKNRQQFQDYISETFESFDLHIYAKNKYNNFLLLIFKLVEQKCFNEKILHHCLLHLLSTGELEQFVYVFETMYKNKMKMNATNRGFYEEKVNNCLKNFTITPKTKFKLKEYFTLESYSSNSFETLAALSSDEEPEKKPIIRSNMEIDIDVVINEFIAGGNMEEAKKEFLKVGEDSWTKFYGKWIQTALEQDKQEELKPLLFSLWDENEQFGKSFGEYVENNLVNLYGEYEMDFPLCKQLFLEMIGEWLKRDFTNRETFVNMLLNKKTEDEDESYNIELFNENITNGI